MGDGEDAVLAARCPLAALREPRLAAWLSAYLHYAAHHVLPRAGGLDDQDHRVWQAFTLLEAIRRRAAAHDGPPRSRE